MQRFAQVARAGFASAMIALGVIGVAFHDFAIVWGPVPKWVPWPSVLAGIWAVPPLVAGIALLFRRTAVAASRVLLVFVGLWWLLFKVPPVLEAPRTEGGWLVCGMIGMALVAAWILWAETGGRPLPPDGRDMRRARILFGLALIPVGLSHFVYVSLTVPLVPSWLPDPLAWAYFTGACHLAAGLGLLFGVVPWLAARLEAAMLAIFTVVVWIPVLVAAPDSRSNWREICVSWLLTAATAVIAAHLPRAREAREAAANSRDGSGAASVGPAGLRQRDGAAARP